MFLFADSACYLVLCFCSRDERRNFLAEFPSYGNLKKSMYNEKRKYIPAAPTTQVPYVMLEYSTVQYLDT